MRRLFPTALLLCLTLLAGDKPKRHQQSAFGPLLSKGTLADFLVLDIHNDANDSAYKCIIDPPDPRFRDYQVGDKILAGGTEKGDSRILLHCIVVSWTHK